MCGQTARGRPATTPKMAASARAQNMSRSAPSRLDARSAAAGDELDRAASDANTTLLVKASFMGAATRTISAHIRAQVSDRPSALQLLVAHTTPTSLL